MLMIDLKLNGDGAWTDLQGIDPGRIAKVPENTAIQIVTLGGGMASGKPSVMIRLDLPDGRLVLAETSVALFQMAAAAMTGRYGDLT